MLNLYLFHETNGIESYYLRSLIIVKLFFLLLLNMLIEILTINDQCVFLLVYFKFKIFLKFLIYICGNSDHIYLVRRLRVE